ncbi:MAG: NYN domain-containing protein [Planctomycetota bacterium]
MAALVQLNTILINWWYYISKDALAQRNSLKLTTVQTILPQGHSDTDDIWVYMRYVVDACNLIFCDHKLEAALDNQGFQTARELLVAMLTRFARAEGLDEIIAVFDGSEKAAHHPRRQSEPMSKVTLIYADPRDKADRFIIDLVEDAQRPGEITVVTGDKFIIRQVLRAQGHHISCRDFLRRISQAVKKVADPLQGEDPRKFGGALTKREVEEWMKWFGFEE